MSEHAVEAPECEGFDPPAVWKRGQFAVVPQGVGVVSRSGMSNDAYVRVELPDGTEVGGSEGGKGDE